MKDQRIQINFRLSLSLKERIDSHCKENDITVASFIIKLIEQKLDNGIDAEVDNEVDNSLASKIDEMIDSKLASKLDNELDNVENLSTVIEDAVEKMIDDKLATLLDKLSHFESRLEKLEKKDDSLGELDSESPSELDSGLGITDTDSLDNSLESHSESPGADVELDEVNPISEPQKTFSVQDVCCNSGWSIRKIQRESKISNLEKRELLIPSYDYSRAFKLIEGTKPYRFVEVTLELFNEWLMSA